MPPIEGGSKGGHDCTEARPTGAESGTAGVIGCTNELKIGEKRCGFIGPSGKMGNCGIGWVIVFTIGKITGL